MNDFFTDSTIDRFGETRQPSTHVYIYAHTYVHTRITWLASYG